MWHCGSISSWNTLLMCPSVYHSFLVFLIPDRSLFLCHFCCCFFIFLTTMHEDKSGLRLHTSFLLYLNWPPTMSNLQPKPKSVYLQELGKRTKCEQEVSFKEEVILIQRRQRTGFFQYPLKARHCAGCFECIVSFWGQAGFFRAGNGALGRLSNFLKSVPCSQSCPPRYAEQLPTFKTQFKHHLFSQREELGTPPLFV